MEYRSKELIVYIEYILDYRSAELIVNYSLDKWIGKYCSDEWIME